MNRHRHFSIEELSKSDTATKRGIYNVPPIDAEERMHILIEKLLDPIRDGWGSPIRVTSGYRCQRLNKVVGGVWNSQHLSGEAADITLGSIKRNRKLFSYIRNRFVYDQLIWENGGSWIHVSYSNTKNRMQCFSATK